MVRCKINRSTVLGILTGIERVCFDLVVKQIKDVASCRQNPAPFFNRAKYFNMNGVDWGDNKIGCETSEICLSSIFS